MSWRLFVPIIPMYERHKTITSNNISGINGFLKSLLYMILKIYNRGIIKIDATEATKKVVLFVRPFVYC